VEFRLKDVPKLGLEIAVFGGLARGKRDGERASGEVAAREHGQETQLTPGRPFNHDRS